MKVALILFESYRCLSVEIFDSDEKCIHYQDGYNRAGKHDSFAITANSFSIHRHAFSKRENQTIIKLLLDSGIHLDDCRNPAITLAPTLQSIIGLRKAIHPDWQHFTPTLCEIWEKMDNKEPVDFFALMPVVASELRSHNIEVIEE